MAQEKKQPLLIEMELSHNCESLDNCMFCFNTKSKRYAIANKEVGREAYMKIKKLFLDEIGEKLEKNKDLKTSIYTIGCR
ncbi:hypothetical protein FJZ26_00515 [Candidatus Parvarchaeota archaeon]|nr:hypothetical protein [Candidatus Parvarchaeota archaeon]